MSEGQAEGQTAETLWALSKAKDRSTAVEYEECLHCSKQYKKKQMAKQLAACRGKPPPGPTKGVLC